MGDYKKDSEQDKFRDCLTQGTDDFSDEELLKEFEAVKRMPVPLPIPAAPPDEFEKIWARIQEERAESGSSSESNEPEHPDVIRPRFGWKRLAAIGLIACLVAGSGCMVAMGTKSYFYRAREKDSIKGDVVFNNDSNKVEVNGEDEAYTLIEENLGFRPLKFGYIPMEMSFQDLSLEDGYACLRFLYNNEAVYLIQSKFDKKVSFNYNSDTLYECKVYNKWIAENFNIYREVLSGGKYRYESSVVIDGITYCVLGVSSEEEFVKMVERLTY